MDAVELFESRKVWLRLIQRGHGAGDDHGVRMAALTGQHRHSADGLKDQIYRAAVIAFAIALAVAAMGYVIYRAVCRRHGDTGEGPDS